MAITNAQQFKQLVNPPMKGKKRPGYRGEGGYQGGATNQGGAGPRGDVDDRGSREQNRNQRAQIRAAQVRAVEDLIDRPTFGFTDAAKFNISPRPMRIVQGLGNLFSNAPDFIQPQDFGPANQRLLYRQMMAQEPRNMDTMPTEEEEEKEPFRLAPRFRAEGGSMNDEVVGGEYDFESARQMYGLGKLVKKVTRTVKKIAKSPVGKAAIAYGLYQGYQNPAFKKFLFGAPAPLASRAGTSRQFVMGPATKGIFGVGGELTNMGALKGIVGLSTVAGLTADQQEDETVSPEQLGPRLNIPEYRRDPFGNLAIRFRAEGGSTEQKEPVAKKTMPLLNMGGMEKDYREDGGFVPIGRMEKADDVPARLSKNEFVFTADAVRNAGEGDVDKGAEVMYNMMKNLEAGGEVSEESQGLEGARRMFQTSQRLEEVL